MSEELKPCPECKQVPTIISRFGDMWWYIESPRLCCDVKLVGYPTCKEATESWNQGEE